MTRWFTSKSLSLALFLVPLVALVAADVRSAFQETAFQGKFAPESSFDAVTSATPVQVAIVRSDDPQLPEPAPLDRELSYLQIEDMTRRAVDLAGGFSRLVQPGDRVLIKPNLTTDIVNGTGTTTDIRVIKAMVQLVHEAAGGNVEIIIGEGSPRPMDYEMEYANRFGAPSWEKLWDVAGYQDLLVDPDLAGMDLRLSNLNGPWEDLVQVEVPGGGYADYNAGKVWVHKDVLDADVLIMVPVMKVHITRITVALKNNIGLYPSTRYGFSKNLGVPQDDFKTKLLHLSDGSRDWIEEEIVDMALVSRADFVVVDAVRCLERSAFAEYSGEKVSNQVRRNMILATSDIVAADHVAARLMGFNPDDVAHLTLAARAGLGQNDPERIEVVGRTIEESWYPFVKDADYGQSNRTWLLRGPFDATGMDAPMDHPFISAEGVTRPQAGGEGWSAPIYFFDNRIDLGSYFRVGAGNKQVAYAFTYFDAPQDQKAELWLGSDEAMRIWLNGSTVYDYQGTRGYDLVKDKVPVQIREGENALLVKLLQERGDFDFALNICEPESNPAVDGNRVLGLKFRLEDSPLAGSWVRTLPDTIAGGAPLDLVATVSLDRFDPAGDPPRLTADLSALGGPEEVPLVAVGDNTFRLEIPLPMDVPAGRKPVFIQIEQVSADRTFRATLAQDIVVLPAGDLVIFADALDAGWRLEPARGEVDLEGTIVVYEGDRALALTTTFFRVDCVPTVPVDPVGYQCLRFAIHPGDASASSVASAFNVTVNGSHTVKLLKKDREVGGVDMELRAWQVVEIPLSAFPAAPIQELRFEGNLKGTFYLDEVRLVAAPLPTPVTAVLEEPAIPVPRSYILGPNYPNPFNANTVIPYHLPAGSDPLPSVSLEIYNLQGQRLRTLVARPAVAGRHLKVWDGRDESGRRVASGVYLYRLQAGEQVAMQKMLLLR